MGAMAPPDRLDVDDVDFALDDIVDLPERLARMRSERPASWVRSFGAPALHLTTYDLVASALRDEDAIPGHPVYSEMLVPHLGKTLISLGGEEHRVARALHAPFFRQKLMAGYVAPLFEPTANALIDRFVGHGEADLVDEFTRHYPVRIIMQLLNLDVLSDVDIPLLAHEMLAYPFDNAAGIAAVRTFDEHVRPVIERRRAHPEDDLISALTTVEVDGERMNDEDILGFARLMFPAGANNTFPSLGNVLTLLLQHPDVLAQTVGRPDEDVRWVIEEALRLQPAVCEFFRLTVRDTRWRGHSIQAGTAIITSIMAANRDPAVFENPDVFDLDRRSQHVLTFGLGTHHCIGVHLARAEMAAAVRVLLQRLPNLRVADGEPRPEVHGSIIRAPLSLPVQFD